MTENSPNQQQPSAPPQGQVYFPPQYYQAPEDEIDLRELFGVLWKGKWWIIGITVLFVIASVFYALSLPNEYKATAIVAPASEQVGGGLSAMAGQLGGLASLAGVNLGPSESNDTVIAMELMKTWGFQEKFIKQHNLEIAVFAALGWNQSSNELVLDDELYDAKKKKWIRKAPKGKTVEPTSWELHKSFRENLSVSQDKDSGLVSVSFLHYSPEYAQRVVSWLIKDVNIFLKQGALSEATKNINYLEKQINQTSLSEMQKVFFSLIEEQTKTRMLANVSDEYVFKTISEAKIPEEKYGPKRAVICVMGALVGGLFSVTLLFLLSFFRKE